MNERLGSVGFQGPEGRIEMSMKLMRFAWQLEKTEFAHIRLASGAAALSPRSLI